MTPTPSGPEESAVTCPTCGAAFDAPLRLREHELETHGGEGPGTEVPPAGPGQSG